MEFECFTLVFLLIANCMIFFLETIDSLSLASDSVKISLSDARRLRKGTAHTLPKPGHAGATMVSCTRGQAAQCWVALEL
jgi:hypothetical protein